MSSVDRSTLAAFLGIVAFGGANAVAIKYSNAELAPFWGATIRFGLAALLLGAVVLYRRLPRPRGQALTASVLYGLLNFGGFYALAYWGLLEAPAGLAMIILALVPLLTLLLAVVHRLERFSAKSAFGAVVALAGIAVVFGDRLTGSEPAAIPSLVAILLGAVLIAEATVIVKRFPRSHPVVNNALAMAIGAALLFAVSLLAGEPRAIPGQSQTLVAVGYLIVVGSIGLFMLFLYVIERWTASATSYTSLLMPLVTVAVAAWLVGEPIRPAVIVGGALVIAGVYVGAFNPSFALPLPGLRRSTVAVPASTPAPSSLEGPGCP